MTRPVQHLFFAERKRFIDVKLKQALEDLGRLQQRYFSSKDQLLSLALGVGPDPKVFAVARAHDVPVVAHLRNVMADDWFLSAST